MGDKWFGGRTRNPWNPKQGSSGFDRPLVVIGERDASRLRSARRRWLISSPSTRCGTTGLRPTFGFVPRTGAMALSWTMDNLVPSVVQSRIAPSFYDTIHGPDGKDLATRDAALRMGCRLSTGALSASAT